ncbi:MAG: hypothetical protein IT427_17285 [Pirellulales bacterium]|nr:hypothetical protein [Pirellulales bacterium]
MAIKLVNEYQAKDRQMSPSQTPYLLGFDARENRADRQAWDYERRLRYLFNDGLTKPLSADIAVWPSVFDQTTSDTHVYSTVPMPSFYIGLNDPLFNNLDELLFHLQQHSSRDADDYCVIALACFEPERCYNDDKWPYKVVTKPLQCDPSWMFLGFDIVADQSLLSGLMNCGYDDTERAHAAKQWHNELNDHHLFRTLDKAIEFRTWSDRRVIEHAPFSVVGIYVVGGRVKLDMYKY